MGSNTVVILKNDCLFEYKREAVDLVDQICTAAGVGEDSSVLRSRNMSPYIHVRGATAEILSVHHADEMLLSLIGHNTGYKIGYGYSTFSFSRDDKDSQIKCLAKIVDGLGYKLIKKSK